ncbi:DUF4259 domain-containing protein [Streptomyces sp. NPDC007164]|uniref:DUF4259 domain-containing protein n=1 Tax=Streptomyces sp. NPDC007164 TaxID=3156918 RepID=UPI0034002CF4
MSTWDTGPFDNDTAADFANALNDAEPETREALIRGVLIRTIDATGYLTEAEEAVAAAALIAAQCPGGKPVDMSYVRKHLCPCSLPAYGHSPTKPSPASPATRTGQPQTGSNRRTGSSGEPYSPAFAPYLPRHPLPSLFSISSHNGVALFSTRVSSCSPLWEAPGDGAAATDHLPPVASAFAPPLRKPQATDLVYAPSCYSKPGSGSLSVKR